MPHLQENVPKWAIKTLRLPLGYDILFMKMWKRLSTTVGGNTMYRPCDTGFGFAYWRYWCGSQFWRGRIRGVILCAWVGQFLFGLCAFLLCVQNRSKPQRIEEVKMMKKILRTILRAIPVVLVLVFCLSVTAIAYSGSASVTLKTTQNEATSKSLACHHAKVSAYNYSTSKHNVSAALQLSSGSGWSNYGTFTLVI